MSEISFIEFGTNLPEIAKNYSVISGTGSESRFLYQITKKHWFKDGFQTVEIDCKKGDFQEIYQELATLPFLIPGKIILLSSFHKIPTKSLDKLIVPILSIAQSKSNNVFVFLESGEDKTDKRKSFYKKTEQFIPFIHSDQLWPQEKEKWIDHHIKLNSLSLDSASIEFLNEFLPDTPSEIENEIEKLSLIPSEKGISLSELKKIIIKQDQENLFEIIDDSFLKNKKDLIKKIQTFSEDPFIIHSILTRKIQDLWFMGHLLKDSKGKELKETAKQFVKLLPVPGAKSGYQKKQLKIKASQIIREHYSDCPNFKGSPHNYLKTAGFLSLHSEPKILGYLNKTLENDIYLKSSPIGQFEKVYLLLLEIAG